MKSKLFPQETSVAPKRARLAKRLLLGTVSACALTMMSGSAFAACSGTTTISGTDCVLPNAAGAADYSVASGTTVSGENAYALYINGTINSFTNNGTIDGTTNGRRSMWIETTGIVNAGIFNNGLILNNNWDDVVIKGTVSGGFTNSVTGQIINQTSNGYDAFEVYASGSIFGGLNNAGAISSEAYHGIHVTGFVDSLNNQRTGSISTSVSGSYAVIVDGRVDNLYNSGTISSHDISGTNFYKFINGSWVPQYKYSAIKILSNTYEFGPNTGPTGSIGNIFNSGTVAVESSFGAPNAAIDADPDTSIDSITNTGNIYSVSSYGIKNLGTLGTLNNYQGATGSGGSALTYGGRLPTFYNMIAYGDKYGHLAVDLNNHSGQLIYGLFGGDPVNGVAATTLNARTYVNVMSGLNAEDITNANTKVYTFGKHASLWLRPEANSATTWDLVLESDRAWSPFLGWDDPSVINTYRALASNQQATEGILHQRYALLNAVMNYDCRTFDKYGVCIQFAARATGFGTQTTGAGVLNASYRIADRFRVGAYLDLQVAQGNPFGMNLGSGFVQQGNNNPTFGGYIGYSEKPDDTGLQARVSGGYNPGNVSVMRAVLPGAEPGMGNAGLNAYYVHGTVGYGVKLGNGMIITPYAGLQYTDITRNAFIERYNPVSTMYPLAYNAYYERMFTGLFGLKMKSMLTDKLGIEAALGGQADFTRSANSYSGASYAPGLETFGITHGGAWNNVRPNGMIGAFYNPLPNHRITLTGYTGEQGWGTRAYMTGLLGYQIGF